MPSPVNDPNAFNIILSATPPTAVVPAVDHAETDVNLATGASIDFDFNIDQTPIVDGMVRADQALIVRCFTRLSPSDTFVQILNDILVAADITKFTIALNVQRFPGSQLRIRVLNNSGFPTTTLRAQFHIRSS